MKLKNYKYVIIGAGLSGCRAVEGIRLKDSAGSKITCLMTGRH
jgi:succinate dehydrogenase/fumarate reductase flavoprotein subunit